MSRLLTYLPIQARAVRTFGCQLVIESVCQLVNPRITCIPDCQPANPSSQCTSPARIYARQPTVKSMTYYLPLRSVASMLRDTVERFKASVRICDQDMVRWGPAIMHGESRAGVLWVLPREVHPEVVDHLPKMVKRRG